MGRDGVRRYVSELAAAWPTDRCRRIERDATAIVADVSGFTRLSERLAAHGAEGTEAVKDVINTIFDPCLDAVLRLGGDVVKFAGDGFLAIFDGDHHPDRAACAAAAMQRSVLGLEAVRTPVGRVRPRLTVGADTGKVAALLLADRNGDRLDVVATGAAVDRAFALDSAASVGQVRIGDDLASALPPGWTRRLPRSNDRRLHLPAVPDPAARRVVRRTDHVGDSRFLDPAVVSIIEHGVSPAEHRTISVAFVVVDDGGHGWLGPRSDTPIDRLGEITATVAEACARHDVCWLESDSEQGRIRLLLTVGAPIRREHDTERLVAAVREIVDAHPLCVGVARGRAFVGDVGHIERRTYNVMGPVVNLAARLAGTAPSGSVLLTADVADLVDGAFETRRAPALALKGIAQPVEVLRLHGRRSVPVGRETTSRLRGRHAELRTLAVHLERLHRDGPAAVEIIAEAGVGKSRLVEEVATTAQVAVHRAEGRRDRRTTPYAAIAPLLRGALGIPQHATADQARATLLAKIAGCTPDRLPLAPLIASAARVDVPDTEVADSVSRRFRGTRTRELVCELLSAECAAPALFIAEDVHWFDDASRQILNGLATVERPWLAVATRRPDTEPLEGFTPLELRPLDAEAAHRAVLDVIGDAPMSRRQLAQIVAASGGNPLFARELATSALQTNAGDLPDRVEGIISSRIDRLDLDSRSMLRDLSVAGPHVDGVTVGELLDERGLAAEGLAVLHDFVDVVGGGVRFRHDLYRRAAYGGLSVKRRRELHRRFAAELAARPDAASRAAAIAEHAHHAHDAPMTWLWARTAAAEALEQGAAREAAVHLRRALAATSALEVGPTEEARVAESLGDALDLVGRPAEAHTAYRRARRALPDDPVERARLCRKHARVDERAGRYRSSLSWSTRGLHLLDGRDHDELVAELRLVAGVVRFFQGRFDDAIDLADSAADAAERTGSTATLAQAHLQLEMAFSELGRKPERARHGTRALELFEALDDRMGLANLHLNLGVSDYNEANWSSAVEHYEQSARYYELVGDTIGAEAARNNQAEILTDQGRLDEAGTILDGVDRALRAAQYPLGIAITTSGRARVALRRGDLDAAESLLDEARAAFVALDARHMVIDTDVRRVEHLVWAGDARKAEELAEQVEHDLAEAGPVAVLPTTLSRLRGWAALRLGDQEKAHVRFRQALALAEAEAFHYEVALALDAATVTDPGSIDTQEQRRLATLVRDLGIAETPRPPWAATG